MLQTSQLFVTNDSTSLNNVMMEVAQMSPSFTLPRSLSHAHTGGDRCWRVLLFHREVLVVGPLEQGALLHSMWEILQEEDEYG